MRRSALAVLAVVVVFIAPGTRALAADHSNLEEGLPTELEDAYTTEYLNREAQLAFGYFRTAEDQNKLFAYPRIEFSFARNWQLRVGAPFEFDASSMDRTDGQLGVELFYNFNTEDVVLPAIAVAGRMRFPVGLESEGLDSELKLILTKTVIRPVRGQLHLNAMWQHLFETPEPDERQDGYVIVIGYSQRLTASTLLVADFVRTETIRSAGVQNRPEIGVRFQATPLTVLSLGAAVGIQEESDRVRVVGGVQHSF